jgi:hypothetical protein
MDPFSNDASVRNDCGYFLLEQLFGLIIKLIYSVLDWIKNFGDFCLNNRYLLKLYLLVVKAVQCTLNLSFISF